MKCLLTCESKAKLTEVPHQLQMLFTLVCSQYIHSKGTKYISLRFLDTCTVTKRHEFPMKS